jgi:hypothetical protein
MLLLQMSQHIVFPREGLDASADGTSNDNLTLGTVLG